MSDYFLDTANLDYIKAILKDFEGKVPESSLLGVTTNPSAFNKIGKLSLDEWLDTATDIAKFLFEFSGARNKELHIQIPSSKMSYYDILSWAKLIRSRIDHYAIPVIKVSPLTMDKSYLHKHMLLNVTGLADAAIALASYPYASYVSLIPGRMEEVGIKASEHVRFVRKFLPRNIKIIAGSMRTVDGLTRSITDGAVPTIGTTVLDQIRTSPSILNFDFDPSVLDDISNSPLIGIESNTLRGSFFQQMDGLAATCYKEFYTRQTRHAI